MGFLRRLEHRARFLAARAYAAFPVEGIKHPVFILGCGRSGTTVFGTALSKHRHVTYLNEPRHLWFAAYPQSDIWTHRAAAHNGKLVLSTADADHKKSAKLRRLFRFETIASGKPVLVEKLPINSFRLPLIHEIFPDARFLHIHRNGLDVARSIERLSKTGQWFGANSYKWNQLAQYALASDDTRHLPGLCTSFFDMGLLEWRLSTEAIVTFLRTLPDRSSFELSYEQLIENPVATMDRVLAFLNISPDLHVSEFARTGVNRKGAGLPPDPIPDQAAQIGGPLLPLSMFGKDGLARRAA